MLISNVKDSHSMKTNNLIKSYFKVQHHTPGKRVQKLTVIPDLPVLSASKKSLKCENRLILVKDCKLTFC